MVNGSFERNPGSLEISQFWSCWSLSQEFDALLLGLFTVTLKVRDGSMGLAWFSDVVAMDVANQCWFRHPVWDT